MKDIFYSYSKKICGSHSLTQEISDLYFDIIKTEFSESFLEFLNDLESNNQNEALLKDELLKFKYIILYLWFSSELIQLNEVSDFLDQNKNKFQKKSEYIAPSPVAYYSALIWPSIKAHPIGLTGGYFGHWKYLPEN